MTLNILHRTLNIKGENNRFTVILLTLFNFYGELKWQQMQEIH